MKHLVHRQPPKLHPAIIDKMRSCDHQSHPPKQHPRQDPLRCMHPSPCGQLAKCARTVTRTSNSACTLNSLPPSTRLSRKPLSPQQFEPLQLSAVWTPAQAPVGSRRLRAGSPRPRSAPFRLWVFAEVAIAAAARRLSLVKVSWPWFKTNWDPILDRCTTHVSLF